MELDAAHAALLLRQKGERMSLSKELDAAAASKRAARGSEEEGDDDDDSSDSDDEAGGERRFEALLQAQQAERDLLAREREAALQALEPGAGTVGGSSRPL